MAASLYTIPGASSASAQGYSGEAVYGVLKPAGVPGINVVQDFPWTLTPKGLARNETPFAILTEFEIDSSLYGRGVQQYANMLEEASSTFNIYEALYGTTKPTGFWYTIPYFGDASMGVTSSWAAVDALEKTLAAVGNAVESVVGSVGGDKLKALIGNLGVIGSALKIAGGAYLGGTETTKAGFNDTPQVWDSSTPKTYNISFVLLNTPTSISELEDISQIRKNWELCYLLTHQNTYGKKTLYTNVPPVFYKVHIPGIHYSPAARIDVNIKNIGNIRHYPLADGGRMTIPDAFLITLSITDLIMPSRNNMKFIESADSRISSGLQGKVTTDVKAIVGAVNSILTPAGLNAAKEAASHPIDTAIKGFNILTGQSKP